LQSSAFSHRISDAKRKKRPFSNGRYQKTQTRIAFTKIQNHLEHLQYSTPPAEEHNTRIKTFTHIFFAEILARRYNENFLPFYSEPP